MNGEIDQFIVSYLKQEAKNEIHPIVYAGPDHLFL